MRKTPKTMIITTLSGKNTRIKKAEIADIIEQNLLLGGGFDVVVIMKSGYEYIVRETKKLLRQKINERA